MPEPRLLSILMQLRTASGRLTAKALVARCGGSVRTIGRDLERLETMHAPTASRRGRGGGVYLEPDYRRRLAELPEHEARDRLDYALAKGGGPFHFHHAVFPETGIADPPKLAPAKSVEESRVHTIEFDPLGWDGETSQGERLRMICDAIAERRWLSFLDSGAPCKVKPLQMIWKADAFFLLGEVAGVPSAWRVDTLRDLRPELEFFEAAAEPVSCADAWRQEITSRRADLRRTTVTVRYGYSGRTSLSGAGNEELKIAVVAAPVPQTERTTLEFECTNIDRLLCDLRPIASADFEILGPPELRHRFAKLTVTRGRPNP